MRFVLGALLCAALAWAQPQKALEDQVFAQLQGMADQVRATLLSRDLPNATRLATELGLATSRFDRILNFMQLEAELPVDGPDRFYALGRVAIAAYDATDYTKAETYANELLTLAPQHKEDQSYPKRSYGDAIFYGNIVLGRVALHREYNIPKVKAYLLAAGKTPGSATLNSFGPNMTLAKELLEIGERDIVLEFFEECRAFWKGINKPWSLDEWIATVKGCCRLPDFGPNLTYWL